jgi:hypothetical protein
MSIVRLISLRRPLVFFGIPGILLTLAGIGAEIYTRDRDHPILAGAGGGCGRSPGWTGLRED